MDTGQNATIRPERRWLLNGSVFRIKSRGHNLMHIRLVHSRKPPFF
jgi:hypothetical protein